VLCSAHSKELLKHGLPAGLKNYSAAYCTGLLLARRLLKQLGMDELYSGVEDVNGDVVSCEDNGRTYYMEEIDEERRPFRAFLDVGIKNTTTGARVFGALKGASDGGLDIPHNHKRFPGYSKDTKSFDAEAHVSRIMGEHVSEYMTEMLDDDEEKYKGHFSIYLANGIDGDAIETTLEKVHESIRANPEKVAKSTWFTGDKSFAKTIKTTYEDRKQKAAAKKAGIRAAVFAEDDEEEDN
jgi:large subunit ribosomal protein L5e